MKKFLLGSLFCALGLIAHGQETTPAIPVENTFNPNGPYPWEITVGGSGSANHDVDSSFGGLSISLGRYASESLEWLVRQNINYSNPDGGDDSWNGWTRLAVDTHFGDSALRPFFGLNAGRIYGDGVHDTWTAGLETGAKWYVTNRTFIQLIVEYGWFFDHGEDFDDQFDDGIWSWNLGVGYRF